jgi:uncharacterized protein YllA (UPF0747 family)
LLRESYGPEATYGSGFARLFTRLFDEWGVILLDASDAELNAVAEPIYREAIERSAELEEALLERDKQLEAAGYHQQVKITPSSTLLFGLKDGARVPIQRDNAIPPIFLIGDDQRQPTRNATQNLIRASAVSAQTWFCGLWFRITCYRHWPTTGGSAEVAYFAQAAVCL